jgi:PKD repeat protein
MKTKHLLIMLFLFLGTVFSNDAKAQCSASFYAIYDSTGAGGYFFGSTSTGNYTSTTWSFGDGTSSTQSAPYHTYNANGLYYACLTITGPNCQSTVCDTIYVGVSQTCLANFGFQVTGNSASFANFSTSANPSTTTYFWSFGDGTSSNSANPIHQYAQAGNYSVCLSLVDSTAGCYDQFCSSVVISGGSTLCNANFYVTDTIGSIYVSPSVYNASSTYSWVFSNGVTATGPFPSIPSFTPGAYTVCLTVANSLLGCTATSCDSFSVAGAPSCNAAFSSSISGSNVSFTNISTASPSASYYWSFGDGTNSIGFNATHQYSSAGTYNACLNVLDSATNCFDQYCTAIIISGPPVNCNAQFFSADSSGNVYFFAQGNNSGNSYSWSFGDGSAGTGQYPVHQYTSSGYYTVCLTVTNSFLGCTATNCDTIYVSGNPIGNCNALFYYAVDTNTNIAYFTNLSTGNYTNLQWSFGNGTSSTQANPSAPYTPGTYIVCLTVYNNLTACQSSYCDTVVVGNGQASCVPVFFSYPDSTFGATGVYFGVYNTCPGTQYIWSFGDSITGSGASPLHQYADTGWYEVCVTAYTTNGNFTYCDSVYSFRIGNITGIDENAKSFETSIRPNPTSGPVNLSFNLTLAGNVKIELLSIEGRIISTYEDQFTSGLHNYTLNVDGAPAGIYLIRLNSNNQQSISRLIVQP